MQDIYESFMDRFKWYTEQMERAFELGRYQVFRRLSSDRFLLLRMLHNHPERARVLALYQKDSKSWSERLQKAMSRKKTERARWAAATRRRVLPPRRGRFINTVG